MKTNIRNFLTFLVGWPLSLTALYFIFNSFSPSQKNLQSIIGNIKLPLVIVGLCSFLIYYFLRSVIWKKILSMEGISLTFQESAFLWASSEFKRYIPGNIWSFLGRSVSFSKIGISGKTIAKALIIELQIVLMGAVLSSLLSLSFFLSQFSIPAIIKFSIITLIVLLTLFFVVLYIFQNKVIKIIPGNFRNLVNRILPIYKPNEIFHLLFISTIAFFFFGAGYYFSISSIFHLNSTLVISLISFFVLSLLIGLFSFITPTGLGVREGMVTFGLLKILPEKFAGFSSLFGRLSLVVSEFIFLLATFSYSRLSRKLSKKIEGLVSNNRYGLLLGFFIMIFNLYFIPVSFLRHDNFYTGRFDLGNMDQTVWNTKNGRIFEFTNPDGTENLSRLAFHADFILILLAPFYFLWEDPKMLLLIQSIIVSLGAMFVYLLALKVFKESYKLQVISYKLMALSLSFSYLMNPSLQWSILYDFHAVTFATTFLIAAFYFLYKKNYFFFIAFGILAGLTKEQVWIPVGLMGLYLAISNIKFSTKGGSAFGRQISNLQRLKKPAIFGLITFFFSLFAFYYLVWHAIPAASGTDEHFALSYFKSDAENPSGLIKNILTAPLKTFNKLTEKNRLIYYRGLMEPVGYLPVISAWIFVFPAADLFLNIFSDKPELHQIYYQYSAVITSFIYIGMIFSSGFILRKVKFIPPIALSAYIVISIIIGGYIHGPMPWTKKANIAMLESPQENKYFINQKLKTIPPDAKVTSTNNLGAHLSHRQNLYTIPHATNSADFIILLIRPNSPKYELDLVSFLRSDRNYSLIADDDGFIMFKNKFSKILYTY